MFPEPMHDREHNGKGKIMQTLAVLWFEFQVAQQRLRASFAQSEAPANWHCLYGCSKHDRFSGVRIKLVDVPNETILSSGMTATVRIEPEHESERRSARVQCEPSPKAVGSKSASL